MTAHAATIATTVAFERKILINFADPPPEGAEWIEAFAAGRAADDDGTNIAAQYARERISPGAGERSEAKVVYPPAVSSAGGTPAVVAERSESA